jgi:hypothetical protein
MWGVMKSTEKIHSLLSKWLKYHAYRRAINGMWMLFFWEISLKYLKYFCICQHEYSMCKVASYHYQHICISSVVYDVWHGLLYMLAALFGGWLVVIYVKIRVYICKLNRIDSFFFVALSANMVNLQVLYVPWSICWLALSICFSCAARR